MQERAKIVPAAVRALLAATRRLLAEMGAAWNYVAAPVAGVFL